MSRPTDQSTTHFLEVSSNKKWIVSRRSETGIVAQPITTLYYIDEQA
nr:hypothetical protein [uncultured Desulfobacter sp.]